MTVCALFGDRDTPDSKLEHIYNILLMLVKEYEVDFFYVGADGDFNELAETALFNLCSEFPYVGYNVIFCAEDDKHFNPFQLYKKSITPLLGAEESPKEINADKINRWMINEADCVMLYSLNNDGEFPALKKYAEEKNKPIYSFR